MSSFQPNYDSDDNNPFPEDDSYQDKQERNNLIDFVRIVCKAPSSRHAQKDYLTPRMLSGYEKPNSCKFKKSRRKD